MKKSTYFFSASAFILALTLAAFCLSGCGELDIQAEYGGAEPEEEALIDEIPDWNGKPYIRINKNVPEFTKGEIKRAKKAVRNGKNLLELTELDRRGRCGAVTAVVSKDTMPDGERGSIGMVQPSGWQLDKYDFIDNGGFLYNRCHLLAWQLSGLNEEERNLITGTRYMNVEGMLPFENEAADYIRTSGSHVLYRAAPVFSGKDLVARGVQLEAYSLDDDGKGLSFNVFCYNVQPGVTINYRNGKNKLDPDTAPEPPPSAAEEKVPDDVTYILNTNTMRFHKTECKGARTIRDYNREWFYGSREEAIKAGYIPCGMCQP